MRLNTADTIRRRRRASARAHRISLGKSTRRVIARCEVTVVTRNTVHDLAVGNGRHEVDPSTSFDGLRSSDVPYRRDLEAYWRMRAAAFDGTPVAYVNRGDQPKTKSETHEQPTKTAFKSTRARTTRRPQRRGISKKKNIWTVRCVCPGVAHPGAL
jgi:hypothetical protein